MTDNHSADSIVSLMRKNWPEMAGPTHTFAVYINRVRDLKVAQARYVLRHFNLSMGELDILVALRLSDAPHVLMPTEIQRTVLITSGGITKLLHQLESRALICRSTEIHDKRCKRVHLTPTGKQLIETAMKEMKAVAESNLGEAFSTAEMDQLNTLLGKAAASLELAVPR